MHRRFVACSGLTWWARFTFATVAHLPRRALDKSIEPLHVPGLKADRCVYKGGGGPAFGDCSDATEEQVAKALDQLWRALCRPRLRAIRRAHSVRKSPAHAKEGVARWIFDVQKEGQLRCVKTLDAPWRCRRVRAAEKPSRSPSASHGPCCLGRALMAPVLEDIDQVLAITFTDKAAGEIKSRVKATLAAEGMAAQALKVDDAWISTIHGMCSRILRMHATELGIDPAFSVLDEATAADLFNAAVEEVLAGQNEFWSPGGLDALFSEYPARSHGGFAQNVH